MLVVDDLYDKPQKADNTIERRGYIEENFELRVYHG